MTGPVKPKMAVQQNHHTMEELVRPLPSGRRRIFIQRDYSEGTAVRFNTKFPSELEDFIDKQEFEHTINNLNSIYHEAEQISGKTYCEGCFACLTAFILYACMETHYEKCLKKAARFVQEQNMTIYGPRGLVITDPAERGLRVIEITIMLDPRS